MKDLNGKVALVTGGGGGIGSAIARNLVEAGARVAVTDLDEARASQVAERLGTGKAAALRLDVTSSADWEAARERIELALGPVDILVNNAGVGFTATLDSIALDAWRWLYEVNVIASLQALRTFLPGMKQRGGDAHVVFLCSVTALHPFAGQGAYTTSKAALLNMARVLKLELAGSAIGVTAVCPGIVATGLRENAVRARPAELAALPVEGGSISIANGMDPAFIGKAVVDAIREDSFYVFTHADYAARIAAEQARMLRAMERSADPDYREPEILLEPLPR